MGLSDGRSSIEAHGFVYPAATTEDRLRTSSPMCRPRLWHGRGAEVSNPARVRSTANAEALDDAAVTLDVAAGQIVEQATTATDKKQQTTTTVVVVLVRLEVFGEVVDAVRQQCDLDLGGTGVTLVLLVLGDDLGLNGLVVVGHVESFIGRACVPFGT